MILQNKRKVIVIFAYIVLGLLLFLLCIFCTKNKLFGKPEISLNSPKKLEAMSTEKFHVDVVLSNFPASGVYPASSIAVKFNCNKLQFLGVRQGTMMTGDAQKTVENMEIPIWTCNTELSNQNGVINAMYIDMTAEDNAYRFNGFEQKKKNVLLRLSFTLRDSALSGDRLHLDFSDAVMASINDSKKSNSLSLSEKSLKAKGCTIKVK